MSESIGGRISRYGTVPVGNLLAGQGTSVDVLFTDPPTLPHDPSVVLVTTRCNAGNDDNVFPVVAASVVYSAAPAVAGFTVYLLNVSTWPAEDVKVDWAVIADGFPVPD